ncbi:cyclin domain protein [Pelomyxa schiedti]|nr:cyclin domain protein [Pelomyxa schiedti]
MGNRCGCSGSSVVDSSTTGDMPGEYYVVPHKRRKQNSGAGAHNTRYKSKPDLWSGFSFTPKPALSVVDSSSSSSSCSESDDDDVEEYLDDYSNVVADEPEDDTGGATAEECSGSSSLSTPHTETPSPSLPSVTLDTQSLSPQNTRSSRASSNPILPKSKSASKRALSKSEINCVHMKPIQLHNQFLGQVAHSQLVENKDHQQKRRRVKSTGPGVLSTLPHPHSHHHSHKHKTLPPNAPEFTTANTLSETANNNTSDNLTTGHTETSQPPASSSTVQQNTTTVMPPGQKLNTVLSSTSSDSAPIHLTNDLHEPSIPALPSAFLVAVDDPSDFFFPSSNDSPVREQIPPPPETVSCTPTTTTSSSSASSAANAVPTSTPSPLSQEQFDSNTTAFAEVDLEELFDRDDPGISRIAIAPLSVLTWSSVDTELDTPTNSTSSTKQESPEQNSSTSCTTTSVVQGDGTEENTAPHSLVPEYPAFKSRLSLPPHMRKTSFHKIKSNSTSSLFIKQTMQEPDLSELLMCMANALQYHIVKDVSEMPPSKMEYPIFSEKFNPLTKESSDLSTIPTVETIHAFFMKIFLSEKLDPEIAIMCLAYVERVHNNKALLLPSTWRRICLAALILASKVWDEQSVWNVDYVHIFDNATALDLNKLEHQFLELIEFTVGLSASLYAKYYFALRDFSKLSPDQFPMKELDKNGARRLEATTFRTQNEMQQKHRRSSSADMPVTVVGRHVIN